MDIRQVEAFRAVALSGRFSKAVRLTQKGEAFLREVESTFSGTERLRIAPRIFVPSVPSVYGSPAYPPCPATSWRKRCAASFSCTRQQRSRYRSGRPSTVQEWVAARRVDLGLATPRAGFTALNDEALMSVAGALLVPASRRLVRLRRPAMAADLADEQFLALMQNEGTRHAAKQVFRDAGISPSRAGGNRQ